MDTQTPGRLQTDHGTEFCNVIVSKLCELFGVRHITGRVGHPASQGKVERLNGFIKGKLRSLLLEQPTVRCGGGKGCGRRKEAWVVVGG